MRLTPARIEALLLASLAGLLALALFGPPIAQPLEYHAFAETRTLWGLPHGLDVLSNLPFALAGAAGLVLLARVPAGALPAAERFCTRLFFIGLLVTAAGSSWYHLAPDDAGLAVDRGAMALAFAGLLGLAAATSASDRAGRALAGVMLVLAPLAVATWVFTGDVGPWVLVQGAGLVLLLLAMLLPPAQGTTLQVRWGFVLLAYGLAKLLEANDHAVYAATGQLLSGHTLKHLAAACAAAPVLAALARHTRRHNGRQPATQLA
jgi:hypothetical protein